MKVLQILCLLSFLLMQNLNAQNVLIDLLKENEANIGPVLEKGNEYEVQIIYTQIDRDENNIPHFNTYSFNLNDNYFYPASTIKMPLAFLALEKLNKLNIKGLDRNSIIKHGVDQKPQTSVETDSSASNGLPSVAHYIKKIFLVSDNDASNRLYEFLGQAYINDQLYDKGFQQSRIIHRLGAGGATFSFEDNKNTNPVSLYNGRQLLYFQGGVHSQAIWDFETKKNLKGKGFFSNGKLINQPFDFSTKNYLALRDLHAMLQSVIFPEGVPAYCHFDLKPDDYSFLYKWMSAKPRETAYPKYDKPDGYVKFFMYEGKEEQIPEHIKIFNKVGFAYGYLTDVAYIIDTKANIEFMVSATIHVNANKIYNDNEYEYDSIGLPFLRKLGRMLYQHELERPRKHAPDLSKFIEATSSE